MTKIMPCLGCKPHEYQDKKYRGNRVFNSGKGTEFKCTVYGKKQ